VYEAVVPVPTSGLCQHVSSEINVGRVFKHDFSRASIARMHVRDCVFRHAFAIADHLQDVVHARVRLAEEDIGLL
jgi:hypothetical protein